MQPTIREKLEHLRERHQEVEAALADPEVIQNPDEFRRLSKEYSRLEPVTRALMDFDRTEQAINEAAEMLKQGDRELKDLAREELLSTQNELEILENRLKLLLLPSDPSDESNIFIEIRAGTGGNEASLFAGDLFRMYSRYAERKRWGLEVLTCHSGERGGFKEIIARLVGTGAYSRLKFESGAHRVQRVPETESQGRIHTSACTVAVLPEAEAVDEVEINSGDLRIDTYRSSGAGGQHVNTTDSAIRITHLPSGIVVECQDERSQHKNKARAMSLLSARLIEGERAAQAEERSATRRLLVGSGDRSQRIRTYNFPQGRITDHRINLTLYKLADFMEGDLDPVIDTLIQQHQAELLAEIGE